MIKRDLFLGSKVDSVSTNQHVIPSKNKKDKNYMIISIHAVKAFHKIQHPVMIKTLIQVRIEGTHLNIINTSSTNILNGKG